MCLCDCLRLVCVCVCVCVCVFGFQGSVSYHNLYISVMWTIPYHSMQVLKDPTNIHMLV